MSTNNDTESYYQNVVPPKRGPVAAPMLRDEALRLLRNESRGAPDWTFKNVAAVPVTVTFSTSVFSPQRQAFIAGPEVRITWAVDEEIGIPASLASGIHQVIVATGAGPMCAGGQAPTQLVRTQPKQDYPIHPSLFPNPAAERAAVTRPKSWAKPESDQ